MKVTINGLFGSMASQAKPNMVTPTLEVTMSHAASASASASLDLGDTAATADLAERRAFAVFTDEDARQLAASRVHLEVVAGARLDESFAHMAHHIDLGAVAGNESDVLRLRAMLRAYLSSLLGGSTDAEHVAMLQRIGRAHHLHKIPPRWYVGFKSHLLRNLVHEIIEGETADKAELEARIDAVTKAIFIDMATVLDTYDAAARQQAAEALDDLGAHMSAATDDIRQGISTLNLTVEEQTRATTEQASAVAEVSAALSELSQTSQGALRRSESMREISKEAREGAGRGIEVVNTSIEGMTGIQDRVGVIQDKITTLSDHTQQIGDIISTVNEIAEQSKLLALNASIEAARAGEFGRSFSVVANEMRDLAEQSKQATRQVRQLLSDIQGATTAAVVATEDGIAQANLGQQLASEAGEVMAALRDVVDKVEQASTEIAEASRQQGTGITQVADAISAIDGSMRTTTEAMEGVREVGSRLTGTSATLGARVEALREVQGLIDGRS